GVRSVGSNGGAGNVPRHWTERGGGVVTSAPGAVAPHARPVERAPAPCRGADAALARRDRGRPPDEEPGGRVDRGGARGPRPVDARPSPHRARLPPLVRGAPDGRRRGRRADARGAPIAGRGPVVHAPGAGCRRGPRRPGGASPDPAAQPPEGVTPDRGT